MTQLPGYPSSPSHPGEPSYPIYPTEVHEEGRRTFSRWAIATLAIGCLVPWAGVLLAIPFGIVALVRIAHHGQRGRWMAIVGMVASLAWIGQLIYAGPKATPPEPPRDAAGTITSRAHIEFGYIRVGDCLVMGNIGEDQVDGKYINGIPCALPHNAQAVHIAPLSGEVYPGEATLEQRAAAACRPHVQEYLERGLNVLPYFPQEAAWDGSADNHRVICVAIEGIGGITTGSIIE